MGFIEEFKVFSSNINQASRAFCYHQEIERQVFEIFKDVEVSDLYLAMQDNSQFWLDYKHMGIFFSVVVLGRIFDNDNRSHSVHRLIKTAKQSNEFNNQALLERKLKEIAYNDAIKYVENKYELTDEDFAKLDIYIKKISDDWGKVKGLRNKIFAHQDVMDKSQKKSILDASKYRVFDSIISRLLTLENILFQAYNNGRRPDYEYRNIDVKNAVKLDVKSLLSKLGGGG